MKNLKKFAFILSFMLVTGTINIYPSQDPIQTEEIQPEDSLQLLKDIISIFPPKEEFIRDIQEGLMNLKKKANSTVDFTKDLVKAVYKHKLTFATMLSPAFLTYFAEGTNPKLSKKTAQSIMNGLLLLLPTILMYEFSDNFKSKLKKLVNYYRKQPAKIVYNYKLSLTMILLGYLINPAKYFINPEELSAAKALLLPLWPAIFMYESADNRNEQESVKLFMTFYLVFAYPLLIFPSYYTG